MRNMSAQHYLSDCWENMYLHLPNLILFPTPSFLTPSQSAKNGSHLTCDKHVCTTIHIFGQNKNVQPKISHGASHRLWLRTLIPKTGHRRPVWRNTQSSYCSLSEGMMGMSVLQTVRGSWECQCYKQWGVHGNVSVTNSEGCIRVEVLHAVWDACECQFYK